MRLSLLLTAAILLFTLPSLDAIPASQGINVVDTVPKVVLDSQLAQRLISQEAFDEATGGVNKGARKIPRAAVNAAMAKFPVGGAPAKPPQLVQAPPKSSVEPPSAQVIAPPPKLSGGQQQKVTVGGPSAPSQQSKVSKFASKPGAPATATDHPIFQRLRKQLVDEQGGKGVGVVPPPPSSGKVVGVVPPPPSSGKVVGVVPPPPSSGKGVELVTGSKAGGGIVQSQHAPPPAPPQDAHLGTLPANGGYAFEQQDGTITKIHSYVNGKYDGGVLDVEFSALNRGAKNAVNVITLTSGGKFYARAYIPIHSAVAYIFTTDEKSDYGNDPNFVQRRDFYSGKGRECC